MRAPGTALLVTVFAVQPGPQGDWPAVLATVTRSVARLEVLAEGSRWTAAPTVCSAVVLNTAAGFAVTAAHCLTAPPPTAPALTLNGRHAEPARVNRVLDLAIVRFTSDTETAIALASTTPPAGTAIAVIGYALGRAAVSVRFGRLSQPADPETHTAWIDADLVIGDSGGAVIDAQGRLVGLAVVRLSDGAARIGAIVPVETLRDFAQPYLPKTGGP